MPKISVIIPSYNHEAFIKSAIQSVLDQTFKDFEIIIYDDNSSDKTVQAATDFNDPRIKVFASEVNLGSAANANLCVEQSKGEFIALLNSDDEWKRTKLEQQMDIFSHNPDVSAVFTDTDFIDHNGEDLRIFLGTYREDTFKNENKSNDEWLRQFFISGNSLCHPSILIKADVLKKLPSYDNRFRQLPDFKMWIELVKQHNIFILNERLVRFRLLPNELNASASTPLNIKRTNAEAYLLFKSFFESVDIHLFKRSFKQELINPDFASDSEFYCEKAFVLLRLKSFAETASSLVGYEMLYEGLNDKKIKNTLLKNYAFGEKEFQCQIVYLQSTTPTNIGNDQILFNLLPSRIPIDSLSTVALIQYTLRRITKAITKKYFNLPR